LISPSPQTPDLGGRSADFKKALELEKRLGHFGCVLRRLYRLALVAWIRPAYVAGFCS
jgi:hypothetical protein